MIRSACQGFTKNLKRAKSHRYFSSKSKLEEHFERMYEKFQEEETDKETLEKMKKEFKEKYFSENKDSNTAEHTTSPHQQEKPTQRTQGRKSSRNHSKHRFAEEPIDISGKNVENQY